MPRLPLLASGRIGSRTSPRRLAAFLDRLINVVALGGDLAGAQRVDGFLFVAFRSGCESRLLKERQGRIIECGR